MQQNYQPFQRAVPVWFPGRETEMNLTGGFRAVVGWSGGAALARLTASTCYQLFVNGALAAFGPARGPHDYCRVDEIDVTPWLRDGQNVIAITVNGANINSFYYPCQSSFLQAEVLLDGQVTAWTEPAGAAFAGRVLPQRVRRVQRYSFQRTFAEAYRMEAGCERWREAADEPFAGEPLTAAAPKALLPRGIPLCEYPRREAALIGGGSAEMGPPLPEYRRDRSLVNIGAQMLGFPMEELEVALTDEAQRLRTKLGAAPAPLPLALPAGSYGLFDFGIDATGFVGLALHCKGSATVYVLFDEILTDGDVDPLRLGCANALRYDLGAGSHELLSFEPYTLRYAKIIVLGAASTVRQVSLTQYRSGAALRADYRSDGPHHRAIYDAAVETYFQNVADLFMDCPSRERAGWLCDSFFTARVERALTDGSAMECQFLQNYLLSKRLPQLPQGMLPMCYPSDHLDGVFIPNWPLWLVLQLEEHAQRDPGSGLVPAFRQRVYELLDYFKPFENEDGLLERLDGWVFVEWSRANDLVQDVNYPTNMLYSAALAAAGRTYGDAALLARSAAVAQTVARLSFDGEFFTDNAVRENGVLCNTGERTEVCQYYAFFFDIATPQTHPRLWNTLLREFGPQRAQTGGHADVAPANSFIGNYLRMDLLRRHGFLPEMLREIEGYFLKMARTTGTLWENDTPVASCCHGFASYIAVLLLAAQDNARAD